MIINQLRFNSDILTRKPPSSFDAETTLLHVAIITYMVEPDVLRTHVHERFEPPHELDGFPDLESGLVLLTHPLRGYFYRRDGKLGSYSVWHDKLQTTEGRVATASFPLLQQLGLIHDGDVSGIHSVLIQPEIDFTIYLPPVAV